MSRPGYQLGVRRIDDRDPRTGAMPTIEHGPALGVLEIATIARGIVVADAALKRAPAVLLASRAVSGGKHLIMLEGGVAEVEEAMLAGVRAAGDILLDRVELAAADDQVWPML
ncbi:MAG: BMC domain-containing protein, partial [Myxococcales bacterium]|nr:BMC domain-containing protein [Myxococcales bacterium]